MTANQIQIFKPVLPKLDSLAPYIRRIDEAQHYSNFGPLNGELEERIALHMGVSKALVATASNATMVLQGALMTSSCRDMPWKIPSWTFSATACAAELSGVAYGLYDVDSSGKLPQSDEVECVLDVCLFGGAPDFNRFANASCLLIDAAASFDALEKIGLPDSSRPVAIALSLHATKTLPAGEGGIFISNDVEWVERFRSWTRFGMEAGRQSTRVGTNAKLNEYNAAVALASLDGWAETKARWRKLAKKAKALSLEFGLPVVSSIAEDQVSPYWIVQCPSLSEKTRLAEVLKEAHIESRNWWESGCHQMAPFQSKIASTFSETDKAAETTLGLPFHLGLNDQDFLRIRDCLLTWAAARP